MITKPLTFSTCHCISLQDTNTDTNTDTNKKTKTITENTNRITSPPTYFLHADVLNILCNKKRK